MMSYGSFVCVVVFACCVVLCIERAHALRSLPECAGVTCHVQTHPEAPSFLVDMTACGTGDPCPKCLSDPEWAPILQSLGVAKVTRTWKPYVGVNSWVSAEIMETIFQILTREAMGYNTQNMPADVTGLDVLCCDETVVALEDWPNKWSTSESGTAQIQSTPIGYEGGSGLYVPGYTVQRYPLATSWAAYKYLPAYKDIFPYQNLTQCTWALRDTTTPCANGNYWCNVETWNVAECTGPRYSPPQCINNPNCRDIYHSSPVWDVGFFEGLIKNTGLNFTFLYLNEKKTPMIQIMAAYGVDVMFAHWEPDPLIALLDARVVAFDPPTLECLSKQNSDPGVSGGNCDYQRSPLQKLARKADLLHDTDFKYFFEAFQFSSSAIRAMIKRHNQGGGNETLYDVSCKWVKENYNTWKEWVRNTPATTSSSSNLKMLIIVIAAPSAAVILAIIIFFIILRMRANAAVKLAPKQPPLTLIFTDVESSTTLWERYGDAMAQAMDIHHAVIREQIAKHECYEVKTIGDSFMIACPTVLDATLLSVDIQTALHEAKWPDVLKYWKEGDDGTGLSWNGLRVRIGLHLCNEVEPKFDMIHRGYDYYGHDVNVSARVESVAQGGQILLDAESYQALIQDPEYPDVIQEDILAIKFASGVELKGVADTVTVYSILPKSLLGRSFQPIPGAVDEVNKVTNLNDSTAMPEDNVSTCSSSQKATTSAFRTFFLTLPNKDREHVLDAWLAANNMQGRGSYERKLKRVVGTVVKREHERDKPTAVSPTKSPTRTPRATDLNPKK